MNAHEEFALVVDKRMQPFTLARYIVGGPLAQDHRAVPGQFLFLEFGDLTLPICQLFIRTILRVVSSRP